MSLKPTRVAMITSCWNRAKYLPRFLAALRSLNLTGVELHWFFAYGPSEDDTLQMLRERELPFESYVVFKKDVEETNGNDAYSTIAEAQNYARTFMDIARGQGYFDFIGYVSPDMVIPPDFFLLLLPHLENPQYAAVCGWSTYNHKFLKRIEELRVDAAHKQTWESPICGGGSTIYRGELFGYHDTTFVEKPDTDFILSITRGKRDYYKTLYVNAGIEHHHEVTIAKTLTTLAFKRGYYGALLVLKHRDYYGNPYLNRANILYFGVILDLPLCMFFIAGLLPWWLGIWSILGLVVAIAWSTIRLRKGIADGMVFSTYDVARELVTHLGLLVGLIRFDILRRLTAGFTGP